MMFVLKTYETQSGTTQGFGVAVRLNADATWRFLTYEIPIDDDPDTWIADNASQVLADAPSGKRLGIAGTVRYLIDDGRLSDAIEMADDIEDVADCDDRPSRLRIFKAFALVLLDEINILRSFAGMQERTVTQLRTALRNKYKSLM